MIGSNHMTINGTSISLHSGFAATLRRIISHKKLATSLVDFLTDWRDTGKYIYQQTSGTTGQPKEIRLRKEAMLISAQKTCNFFNLGQESTLLLTLDTDYIAGKMMVIRAIASGANLIVIPAKSLADNYPSQPIDFVAMVPLQLQNLMENGTNLGNTKTILLGGTAITEAQTTLFEALAATIWLSYASTETYSHVALRPITGAAKSDIYTALPGISFTISQRDTLTIEAPELLDAPLETNDSINLIDKTSFEWLGRADFVINSGGVKIFPELVEKEIAPHLKCPFYISSIKDDKLGEKVVIIIETDRPFSPAEEANILELTKKVLPPYKAPKEVIYKPIFNRTPTGKIIRY